MRSLQRGAVAALLVTTACAVAACGGGGGSSAATTSAGTTANTTTSAAGAAGANGAAFAKYTTCLKQHGVTLPNFGQGRPPGGGAPDAGPGGAPTGTAPNPPTGTNRRGGFGQFDNPKFQKASAACASLRPKFGAGGFGGRGGQNTAAFAAYRNCLTLHGVKTADGFGFGRPGGAAPTAKEKAALSACASLRPTRQARPTGTTATPSTTS
jgi:hypothetical protein